MSRVQLALNVADLEASIGFYSAMFGVEPHKLRPGYANFEVQEPPLKLVLIEVGREERGSGPDGALNHLGVEVESVEQVAGATDRLGQAGLATVTEDATTCCYAQQDKVWVRDPAGTPWEFYTITDDNPADATTPGGSGCCTSDAQVLTVGAPATTAKSVCC